MPNKRTGMDYIDYSGQKAPNKSKPRRPKPPGDPKRKPPKPPAQKGPAKQGPAKKKKKPRYNPFSDGRTPTSASQTTGP